LAPKLSRGGCGCTDIGNVARSKKPWEITEGILCLLKEISKHDLVYVSKMNDKIFTALSYSGFKNADKYHASVSVCVQVIVEEYKKNGKYWKEFKGQ